MEWAANLDAAAFGALVAAASGVLVPRIIERVPEPEPDEPDESDKPNEPNEPNEKVGRMTASRDVEVVDGKGRARGATRTYRTRNSRVPGAQLARTGHATRADG